MSRNKNMRRSMILPLTSVLAVGLAACGSSGSSGAATQGKAGNLAPINIGMPVSLSGYIQALDGPLTKGAQLAADAINKAGGIQGHPIKLIPEDIASLPSQGVSVTQQLLSGGNVSALIMGYSSATAAGVASLLASKGIPAITASVLPQAATWEFSTIPPTAFSSSLTAKYANSLGIKSMGIMYGQTPYGEAVSKSLAAAAASAGITVTDSVAVPASATDLTAQLGRVKNSGIIADALTGPAHIAEANAASVLGLNVPMVMNIDARSTILSATKAYSRARFIAAPLQTYPSVDNLQVKAQDATVISKYGNGPGLSYAGVGWDEMNIMANALKSVGATANGRKLRSALEHVSYVGSEASYTFSATNHDGVLVNPYVIADVTSSGVVVVYPKKAP